MSRPDEPNDQPEHGPAWKAAVALGIDMALVEENLALTVQERFDQLVRLQRLDEELRAAGEALLRAEDR